MSLREQIKRLIVLTEPHAAAPTVRVVIPDNGRGSGPGLSSGGMLTLPPDHVYWQTFDLADVEPDFLRPRSRDL